MYSIWRHGFPHGGGPVAQSFRRPESWGCPMLPKDSLPFIREYSWRIMTPFCCGSWYISVEDDLWIYWYLLYVVLCAVVPGVPIHCWVILVILQLSAEASRLIWRTRSAVCAGGFGQLRCGCCRPSLDQNREPVSAPASFFLCFLFVNLTLSFVGWQAIRDIINVGSMVDLSCYFFEATEHRSFARHVFPHHSNFVMICQTSRHTEMGC